MKKIFKDSLSVLLVLIMVTGLFLSLSLTASANSIASGSCGTNAVFNLYGDNILVISGTGEMSDYEENTTLGTTAPWAAYGFYDASKYGFMQKIVVANGITKIGNYAFHMPAGNNYVVNLINLPDSLETIGGHAFCNELKIESMTIPQNVTSIGAHAFDGCSSLKNVNLYADPTKLTWELENSGLTFTGENSCEIHVMADKLDAYQKKYKAYKSNFVGDLVEPTNVVPAGKNILVSYEDPSPRIFVGALPYSIKSVNEKGTWPITYGARGFVTCIQDDGKYYALTNNNNSTIKELVIDAGNGKATRLSDTTYTDVSLKITHEYVGANSIKMIYTVKNNTNDSKSFQLGSSGDIKIGLDDYATISPLKIDENQIGITMTSTKQYDKIGDNSPTLGFTAKGIAGSDAANYFYGAVGANYTDAATAVKSDMFIPARIFDSNNGNAVSSGNFPTDDSKKDTGLSFFWNVSLEANKEKQFAVIFSVPNTKSTKENETVIDEVISNITTDETGIYKTSNPERTIVFNNEVIPKNDDPLAQANSFSSLKNFLILGVQKKPEMAGTKSIRFVSVVNTNILRDAEEYGYILAKVNRDNIDTYKTIRGKINQITYEKAYGENSGSLFVKNVKETDNRISGNYGKYNEDTPYKYVTLGLNDIPEEKVFIVRFFVKKKIDDSRYTVQYADYYDSEKTKHAGCSADWAAVTDENHIDV